MSTKERECVSVCASERKRERVCEGVCVSAKESTSMYSMSNLLTVLEQPSLLRVMAV